MAKTKSVTFKRRVQLVEGGKEYPAGTHNVPVDELKGWYPEALETDGDIVIGDEEVATPDGAAASTGSTAASGTTVRTGRRG